MSGRRWEHDRTVVSRSRSSSGNVGAAADSHLSATDGSPAGAWRKRPPAATARREVVGWSCRRQSRRSCQPSGVTAMDGRTGCYELSATDATGKGNVGDGCAPCGSITGRREHDRRRRSGAVASTRGGAGGYTFCGSRSGSWRKRRSRCALLPVASRTHGRTRSAPGPRAHAPAARDARRQLPPAAVWPP
jgi:hypothetical protein